ncbi:MAG: hypothetical protein K5897_04735 [Eubacterium sp.]|nr:hypothetical protein [Eubacterium sp.]
MKRFYFICLLCLGILLLISMIAAFTTGFDTGNADLSTTDINAGWKTGDGSDARLDTLHAESSSDLSFDVVGSFRISTDQNAQDQNPDHSAADHQAVSGGTDLCLISTNVVFDVFLGDRLIYSYHPTIHTMHGSTYGNDIHIIPIPSDSSEVTLRIRGEGLDASMFIGFRKAELGSRSSGNRLWHVGLPVP